MAAYGSNAYGSTEYGGEPPQIYIAAVSPVVANWSAPAVLAISEGMAVVAPVVIIISVPEVTATYIQLQAQGGSPIHKSVAFIDPIIYIVGVKKVGWGITQHGTIRSIPTIGGRQLENPLVKNKRGVLIDR